MTATTSTGSFPSMPYGINFGQANIKGFYIHFDMDGDYDILEDRKNGQIRIKSLYSAKINFFDEA